MSLSMYDASVPGFIRALDALQAILAKAAAHAAEKKIVEAALLQSRLFPDMLTFTRQVQVATDFARGTGARLAGMEPPAVEDKETSFAELIARVGATSDYLRTLPAASFDGAETRPITRQVRGEPKTITGRNYLFEYALPNFYFHATTAYALLRHNGLAIGKGDFIGTLS